MRCSCCNRPVKHPVTDTAGRVWGRACWAKAQGPSWAEFVAVTHGYYCETESGGACKAKKLETQEKHLDNFLDFTDLVAQYPAYLATRKP